MPLLNHRTKIDPDKTAQEISKMLSKAGANAILTEYNESHEYVSALSFKMKLNGKDIAFRLPCDWKPVYEILYGDKKSNNIWDQERKLRLEGERRTQSVRVAWRIVKDWIAAQLAIIETKMVKTEQVFLPYAIMGDGRTLYQHVESDPGKMLGGGLNDQN